MIENEKLNCYHIESQVNLIILNSEIRIYKVEMYHYHDQ